MEVESGKKRKDSTTSKFVSTRVNVLSYIQSLDISVLNLSCHSVSHILAVLLNQKK